MLLQNGDSKGDPRLLARATENLLINGCKFCHSKVRVNLITNGQYCCLQIEDDGPGIPAELQKQITQPFVKLDNSRNAGGFGLGLAIVKSILDKHQTQLEIKTSELGGAYFGGCFKKYE